MPRGGKREKAGRKTTWDSGVKFEETSLIRVPNYIKNNLLQIAHRLDAGENIDLVSNSNNEKLQELESKLKLVELENQKLLQEVQKYRLDLETESKKSQQLTQEKYILENSLNNNLASSTPDIFINSIIDFVDKWQKKIKGLPPIDISTKTHQMLFDLKEIASKEKSNSFVPPEQPGNVITINTSENKLVTKSKPKENKLVTKSEKPTQLNFIEINHNLDVKQLSPLNATQLSRRFSKPDDFVKSKKYYYKDRVEEFRIFLKQCDPQGIGWRYSDEDRKYHPIFEN